MRRSRGVKDVYVAVPVQGDRLSNTVYEQLARVLERLGLRVSNPQVLEPPPADVTARYSARDIYEQNRRLLEASGLLVAEISSPSLGVGYEIATAEHLGLPILCVYQARMEPCISLMIRGISYTRLRVASYCTNRDLEAAVALAVREFSAVVSGEQVSTAQSKERELAIEHHFDELAAVYDVTTEWRRDKEMLSWFRNVLDRHTPCLDLATGTGIVGEQLRKNGATVVGVDRSSEMLRRAYPVLNMVVRADVLALPFPDAQFKAVAMRQLLHYTVDDRACLREIARVTAPGGLLACAHIAAPDDNLAQWWREVKRVVQPFRRRYYATRELVTHVAEAGFEIERVDTMALTRRDSWDRFLINCEGGPEVALAVRERLQRTPEAIARRIALKVSGEGVEYTQFWSLILGRRYTSMNPLYPNECGKG